MSKFKFYSTVYSNYDLRLRKDDYLANYEKIVKLINVTITFLGKIELKEFDNIDEGMDYNINKAVNYKFIEFAGDQKPVNFAIITEQDQTERKAYFAYSLHTIGQNWNLYFNNRSKINAQGLGETPNTYFNFTNDNRGYLYLSVLLYTLNNLESGNLEAEFAENKKII